MARRIGLLAPLALVAVVTLLTACGTNTINFSYERGHDNTPLTGAAMNLAGHSFATPAGFEESRGACRRAISNLGVAPRSVTFTTMKGDNGSCLAAAFLSSRSGFFTGTGALRANVDGYRSYSSWGSDPDHHLYTELFIYAPTIGSHDTPYLVLAAQGLTLDQVAAIALSSLPASH